MIEVKYEVDSNGISKTKCIFGRKEKQKIVYTHSYCCEKLCEKFQEIHTEKQIVICKGDEK